MTRELMLKGDIGSNQGRENDSLWFLSPHYENDQDFQEVRFLEHCGCTFMSKSGILDFDSLCRKENNLKITPWVLIKNFDALFLWIISCFSIEKLG